MENRIIVDSIALLKDGTIVLRNEESDFGGEYNKQANAASKMWFKLYQTGELAEVSEYITEHPAYKHPDITVIDFVINSENLKEELLSKIETICPEIRKLEEYTPCIFSNCIGLSNVCYQTYRSNSGCVSSSWEHPFIQRMSTESAYEIRRIADEKGPIAAGREMIDRSW